MTTVGTEIEEILRSIYDCKDAILQASLHLKLRDIIRVFERDAEVQEYLQKVYFNSGLEERLRFTVLCKYADYGVVIHNRRVLLVRKHARYLRLQYPPEQKTSTMVDEVLANMKGRLL